MPRRLYPNPQRNNCNKRAVSYTHLDNQKDWEIAAQMGVANYGQMTAGGWMYICLLYTSYQFPSAAKYIAAIAFRLSQRNPAKDL